MPTPAPSTTSLTRAIYLVTLAVLLVAATLSVLIYRSTVNTAVEQRSTQQLAMVRMAAAAIQGELRGLEALLRQFNSMPSVQNLDVPFLDQRIAAAFGQNPNGIVRYIARIDAEGRFYYWTPSGELQRGSPNLPPAPAQWSWFTDPAHQGQLRVVTTWGSTSSPAHYRALAMPVWRTAPSTENRSPLNDFNGVLALVVDLNRLAEVYLRPALTELTDGELMLSLSMPDFHVRLGLRDITVVSSDSHNHPKDHGTSILDDRDGRLLHAWSKLVVANESWLVASSLHYSGVVAKIQRNAIGQLALMVTILVMVPIGGWLVARHERSRQEEQRRLERQLAESQKMEAIGKLAGGVAHDFNNMLTAILGYASLIHEDAPADSPIREQARQIGRAADSATVLTHQLLAFSRRQMLQVNQFDFTLLIDGVLLLVRRLIGENITVTSDAEAGLWPVLADSTQVEQSIVNLAINARDAMPDGGTLQIVARNAPRPNGERRPDGDVPRGNYVQITVTDTGTGMDDTTRARMFDPFFTTKSPGKGTGLGLSTVYGFIRQCGGYIGVTSTPGLGTSIELLLPRAPDMTPATTTPTPTPLRAARPSIRVLLMSGYADNVVTKDDLKEATLLLKPFGPAVLTKAVSQVLDQPLSQGTLKKE